MTMKDQLAKVREALGMAIDLIERVGDHRKDREIIDYGNEALTILDTIAQAGYGVEPEWFFRWAARAKGDGRYQEAVDVIFNHPENPYTNENPWAQAQGDDVKMEDIVQEITYHLNQARCLEKRTVGNHELAVRIFENLVLRGFIAATSPKQDDIAEKLAVDLDAAHDMIRCLIPLAKGYVAANSGIRSTECIIEDAEAMKAAYEKQKGGD